MFDSQGWLPYNTRIHTEENTMATKMTDAQIRQVIETALLSAKTATNNFIAKNGDRDMCGFAWAVVAPGTSKVARILKEYGGCKAYGVRGIQLWNPSGHFTQGITAKEMGARAFVEVMQANFPELDIYSSSRLD